MEVRATVFKPTTKNSEGLEVMEWRKSTSSNPEVIKL